MKRLLCSAVSVFLITGFLGSVVLGGTTGTLAGFVKTKSKEPLIGAYVIVKDLGMGTATDEKGFYILNNVPAGTHTLMAKMMGYKTTTVRNVVAAMDLRTTINITMETTVLRIGEEVTVTAERPLIQQDVTSTTRTVLGKEISDQLPINSFKDVIKLQPGVVEGHIRGGRETEVLYLVDGLPVQQAISGGMGSNLPNTSVVDLSIQTGGFNAEYGNAMSGVVNAVTKSGGGKFQSQVKAATEDFGVESLESEGTRRYELNLGGPWTGKGNYFFAGNIDRTDTRYHQDQTRFHHHPIEENRNATGKLTYRFTPNMRLSAEGLYSKWHWYEYQYRWHNNLDGLPPRDKESYRLSGTWTQSLTPKMFYTLSGSRYTIRQRVLGPDSTWGIVFDRTGNWVRNGDLDWKQDSREVITIAKGDFTDQATRHLQLKAGGEVILYDLRMDNHKQGLVFGGDTTGDTTRFNTFETHYRYQPRSGSAYLQQKLEYEGMVVNAGFRYDFLDPRAQRPLVDYGYDYGQRAYKPIVTSYVPAKLKWQVSPRLGLALPITERDFFFINYGYFFQMPTFDYLYTNLGYDYSGSFPISGDPDLKAEQTVAWELAYQRAIRKEYLISLTYFSKDISNLVDTKTYTLSEQSKLGYTQFVNLGLATVRGLEVFLEKRPTHLVSGKVAYTFMTARGTSSSAGEGYNWYQWGVAVPRGGDYYLSWDQRHTLVVNLDLRDERRWGISSILRLNSPLPYTRRNDDQGPNNGRMRSRAYLDIKASRDLYWNRLRFSLFADCRNVLDNRNLLWVDADGNPGGTLKDPSAYSTGRRATIGLATTF